MNAEVVVTAEVVSAAYTDPPRRDYRPWEGSVVLQRTLKGHTDKTIFKIHRTGISSACDDGTPAPKSGDMWVVYLKSGHHVIRHEQAYPLDIAHEADPQLETLLTSPVAK